MKKKKIYDGVQERDLALKDDAISITDLTAAEMVAVLFICATQK